VRHAKNNQEISRSQAINQSQEGACQEEGGRREEARQEEARQEGWYKDYRLVKSHSNPAVYHQTDYTLCVRAPEGNRVGLSHWPDGR
jgi:hypothetical protein